MAGSDHPGVDAASSRGSGAGRGCAAAGDSSGRWPSTAGIQTLQRKLSPLMGLRSPFMKTKSPDRSRRSSSLARHADVALRCSLSLCCRP